MNRIQKAKPLERSLYNYLTYCNGNGPIAPGSRQLKMTNIPPSCAKSDALKNIRGARPFFSCSTRQRENNVFWRGKRQVVEKGCHSTGDSLLINLRHSITRRELRASQWVKPALLCQPDDKTCVSLQVSKTWL